MTIHRPQQRPPRISTRWAVVGVPTGHTRSRTMSPRSRGTTDKPQAPSGDTFTAVRYYMTPAAFCSLRRAHSVSGCLGCRGGVIDGRELPNSRLCEKSVAIFFTLILIYHHTNIIPLYYYYNIVFCVNNTVETFSRCHCTRDFSTQDFLHFSDYGFDRQKSPW